MESLQIFDWIGYVATILGFCCVFLEIKQRIACWYFGISSAVLFGLVFFHTGLYAYGVFQIYYATVSIYGLIMWRKGTGSNDNDLPVTHVPFKILNKIVVLTIVFTAGIFVLLLKINATLPFKNPTTAVRLCDSLITVLSIFGTWMLAKKYFEQWFAWIIADLISVGLFFSLGPEFFPEAVLYFSYVVMASVGILHWRKSMDRQQKPWLKTEVDE